MTKLLLWLLLLVGLSSCENVTLVVKKMPSNTPTDTRIFVAGNFNRWNPGDRKYVLQRSKDGTYFITLPRGLGQVEYKFTRGDWESSEANACGEQMQNRRSEYGSADSVFIEVLSWEDLEPTNCPNVTIVLDKIPETTPNDADIYLACNFNEWDDSSDDYLLQKNRRGKYYITIPRKDERMEFKFTRGDWESEEVSNFGELIENRLFDFGKTDTLHISIANWKDIKPCYNKSFTLRIQVPASTPPSDKVYLTGNFNDWNPKDERYVFRPGKNGYYLATLPSDLGENTEFKITRGSWEKQEANERGDERGNRGMNCGWTDTLDLRVIKWLDQVENR